MSHPAAVLQTFQADGRTIRLQYMTPDDGAALLEFARSVPRHDLLHLRTDISTVEALKKTLMDAKSVAWSASASGRFFSCHSRLMPLSNSAFFCAHSLRRS